MRIVKFNSIKDMNVYYTNSKLPLSIGNIVYNLLCLLINKDKGVQFNKILEQFFIALPIMSVRERIVDEFVDKLTEEETNLLIDGLNKRLINNSEFSFTPHSMKRVISRFYTRDGNKFQTDMVVELWNARRSHSQTIIVGNVGVVLNLKEKKIVTLYPVGEVKRKLGIMRTQRSSRYMANRKLDKLLDQISKEGKK